MTPKSHNRPLHLGAQILIWLASAMFLGAVWVAFQLPEQAHRFYTNLAWPPIGRFLASASGAFTFSVFECLTGIILAWVLIAALLSIWHVARGERGPINALLGGVSRLITLAAILMVSFYAAWGINYAQPDLPTRLGWNIPPAPDPNTGVAAPAELPAPATPEEETAELERLCTELVDATNRAYQEAFNSDDIGQPSSLGSIPEMDRAIDRAYERVAQRLTLPPAFSTSYSPAKPLFFSLPLSYIRLSGIYGPWTGEANYNKCIPKCSIPHTIAHEKAHQRGVTSEDEANFFGYITALLCEDPIVRYSGSLFAQQELLAALSQRDQARMESLMTRRLPGVQRDIEAEAAFWATRQGKASQISDNLYDQYLKVNQVKGGIASYAMSTQLIIRYARRNGGACIPSPEDPIPAAAPPTEPAAAGPATQPPAAEPALPMPPTADQIQQALPKAENLPEKTGIEPVELPESLQP